LTNSCRCNKIYIRGDTRLSIELDNKDPWDEGSNTWLCKRSRGEF